MSYTEIRQRPNFEFGGLLGDIGGFMGLLLGASIMTVCELLDYLGMKVIHWWLKRREQRRIQDQRNCLSGGIKANT